MFNVCGCFCCVCCVVCGCVSLCSDRFFLFVCVLFVFASFCVLFVFDLSGVVLCFVCVSLLCFRV